MVIWKYILHKIREEIIALKHFHIIIIAITALVTYLIYALVDNHYFDVEDLKGNFVQNSHLSLIGDYVFYDDYDKHISKSKAKNLITGKTKITGVGLGCVRNVSVFEGELYYLAPRSVNPEHFLFKRGLGSLIEKKLTKDIVSQYEISNDFLYYTKKAYASDNDYNENGNIFRINMETQKIEKEINDETDDFFVCDDKIYYSKSSNDSYNKYKKQLSDAIVCHFIESDKKKVIIEDWIDEFCIDNNNIFYSKYIPGEESNQQDEKFELIWLNLDTNDTKTICKNVRKFKAFDGRICYIDNDSLSAVNFLNYKNNEVLTIDTESIDYDNDFILYNEKFYYYDQYRRLCEVSISK